jgi:hypothetical protein
MKYFILVLLLLALPMAMAYQVNTTVTIDWIGNDNAYLRTESGDFLFSGNSSLQVDQSYILNLTRISATNQSDLEQIISLVHNVSSTCSNITTLCYSQRNYTDQIYNELLTNWSRCNLDKNALMLQRDGWESERGSYATNYSMCNQLRGDLMVQYNRLVESNNNQSIQFEQQRKKASDNLMYGLLGVAALVGVIWYFSNASQQKPNRPGPMNRMSFTGRQPSQ